jgi:hypothetical protein
MGEYCVAILLHVIQLVDPHLYQALQRRGCFSFGHGVLSFAWLNRRSASLRHASRFARRSTQDKPFGTRRMCAVAPMATLVAMCVSAQTARRREAQYPLPVGSVTIAGRFRANNQWNL